MATLPLHTPWNNLLLGLGSDSLLELMVPGRKLASADWHAFSFAKKTLLVQNSKADYLSLIQQTNSTVLGQLTTFLFTH